MLGSITPTMGVRTWCMLLLLSVLWGWSFFLIEIAIAELPTLTIVLIRVALAAVTLWLFVFIKGMPVPSSLRIWGNFFVMGLLNNALPFSLIVWGQVYITSGLASILNATTPLFAVIVASVLLQDEKATVNKWIGILIGFTGIVVMIGPSALEGVGVNVLAQLAVLGGAFCYACAGFYGRRFKAKKIHPVVATAGQTSLATVILMVVVFLFERPLNINTLSAPTIMAMIALAVFSTAIAYVLYFNILASSGATNLLLVTFLIPISAIFIGMVLLGEVLQTTHVMGMVIIGIGLVAIDGRLLRLWFVSRVP